MASVGKLFGQGGRSRGHAMSMSAAGLSVAPSARSAIDVLSYLAAGQVRTRFIEALNSSRTDVIRCNKI